MADQLTIVYPPGSVYFEAGEEYNYVKLGYVDRPQVHLLVEASGANYTEYRLIGPVLGAGTWQTLPTAAATGRWELTAKLSTSPVLTSDEDGPFELAGTLTIATATAEASYVEETVDLDGELTAEQVAQAINAACANVTATVVGGRLTLTANYRGAGRFLTVSAADGTDEALGLDWGQHDHTTVYEKSWRGLSSEYKRVRVQLRTAEGTTSDVLTDWVVLDRTVPILPSRIRTDFLFGIPLTDGSGRLLADEHLWEHIRASLGEFEELTHVRLTPTRIVSSPERRAGENLRARHDYDLAEASYDYDRRDGREWFYLRTREWPYIGRPAVRLVYHTGAEIIEFPEEWIRAYPATGQIHITPSGSGLGHFAIKMTGQYMPLTAHHMGGKVPGYIWIDYTAGFPVGQAPPEAVDAVGKLAAIRACHIGADATMFGISSQSISDGAINESISTTAGVENALLGARIIQYKKELEQFIPAFRERHRGPELMIV